MLSRGRSPRAVQRVTEWSAEPQTRGPACLKRNRGPGSAVHHFVLHRARDTRGENCLFRGQEPARAFSMKSVRSTFFQSGIAEIFFSLSSASAWPVM
jgi:hypothetical protein